MKVTILSAIAGVVAVASAQSLADLPTCAQGCVGQSVNVPGCTGLDVRCICSATSFLSNIACCIASSCQQGDQDRTLEFSRNLCRTAGVTIPDSVICSTASRSSTASSTSSSSSSSSSTTAAANDDDDDDDEASSTPASNTASPTGAAATASSISASIAQVTGNAANAPAQIGQGVGLVGLAAAIMALV